ncbi:hypothetical protein VTK73DRAFT_3120 [Phialemonium thermophilum]|uniref:Nagb/rpia/CoA transferase-like protein n=1 Tax=Phialemonium thermophilum TaxID=223376 RepID=A0ABR3VM39_9PEZI
MEDTLGQHKAHPDSSHSMKWRDAILEDLARRIALRSSDSAKLVSNALVQYLTSQFREKLESARPLAILTLSESSTITHGLRTLLLQARFSLDLRILESRPLYEGVSLAGSLLNLNGIVPAQGSSPRESSREVGGGDQGSASATKASQKLKISLFTDASAALAARDVDVVVVGADRIASNGAVSNKTGTLPAMLSARHVANGNGNGSRPVKVIVLSESEKVAPREDHEDHVVEDNDPTQLIRAWGAEYNGTRVQEAAALIAKRLRGDAGGDDHGRRLPIVEVAVHNIFFEWCPPELIDVYLTEYGEWAAQDIREHAERLGAERERLFADI